MAGAAPWSAFSLDHVAVTPISSGLNSMSGPAKLYKNAFLGISCVLDSLEKPTVEKDSLVGPLKPGPPPCLLRRKVPVLLGCGPDGIAGAQEIFDINKYQ